MTAMVGKQVQLSLTLSSLSSSNKPRMSERATSVLEFPCSMSFVFVFRYAFKALISLLGKFAKLAIKPSLPIQSEASSLLASFTLFRMLFIEASICCDAKAVSVSDMMTTGIMTKQKSRWVGYPLACVGVWIALVFVNVNSSLFILVNQHILCYCHDNRLHGSVYIFISISSISQSCIYLLPCIIHKFVHFCL